MANARNMPKASISRYAPPETLEKLDRRSTGDGRCGSADMPPRRVLKAWRGVGVSFELTLG